MNMCTLLNHGFAGNQEPRAAPNIPEHSVSQAFVIGAMADVTAYRRP